jgi:hypothetical protein
MEVSLALRKLIGPKLKSDNNRSRGEIGKQNNLWKKRGGRLLTSIKRKPRHKRKEDTVWRKKSRFDTRGAARITRQEVST